MIQRILILIVSLLALCSCNDHHKNHTVGKNNIQSTQRNIAINNEADSASLKVPKPKKEIDSSFLTVWDKFIVAAKKSDINLLKSISISELEYKDTTASLNEFLKYHYSEIFTDTLRRAISDKSRIEIMYSELDNSSSLAPVLQKELPKGICSEMVVNVTTVNTYPPVIIIFKFIKTPTGYKFYAYDRVG